MENQATRADVFAALAQKSGFQVVEEKETPAEAPRQLRIMGRNHIERWPFFLPVIHRLLTLSGKSGWTCDISKQYVAHEERVAYGWRIIFQSDNLSEKYAEISSAIRSAPSPARVELSSVPLPGYKPGQLRGGINEKGKGVASAGSLPMALTRRT